MAKDGVANTRIATALGVSRPTVLDWRRRFREDCLNSVVEIREEGGAQTGDQCKQSQRPSSRHVVQAAT